MNDPISDMLTRIRNSYLSRGGEVSIPYSKLKAELAKLLVREGLLRSVNVASDKKTLTVSLKYDSGIPAVQSLRRISKPGLRVYQKAASLRPVRRGLGILVLSTNRGLMTGEDARKRKLGGEVLAEVY